MAAATNPTPTFHAGIGGTRFAFVGDWKVVDLQLDLVLVFLCVDGEECHEGSFPTVDEALAFVAAQS